jgi:hypothetical protein
VVSIAPSWHHTYASLAWIGAGAEPSKAAHYPSIKPELVELTSALHGLAHDPEMRAQYVADAPAFADKFQLAPEHLEALIKLDVPAIVKMGTHPLAARARCKSASARADHPVCSRAGGAQEPNMGRSVRTALDSASGNERANSSHPVGTAHDRGY